MTVRTARAAAALLVAGAVASASVSASARGDGPALTRIEGPFGQGANQVWLLRPDGPIRTVVVFGHGWKVYPPSPGQPWVNQFRPWLDHLVARGSAVIFPRYQLGTNDVAGVERLHAYRLGVARGFARLRVRGAPVVAIGYSYGASLAMYYAAEAGAWALPRPVAVDAVFPAGPIAGASLPPLPAATRVLIQVGDRDSEAGAGGALAFWAALASHPSGRKRYEVVRSSGSFIADHAAPKRSDAAARSAFWAPLDELVASARTRR